METPWRRWDVTTILWASLALVLVALVANPLLRLLWTSFEGPGGAFTLGNYVQAFSRPRYLLGFRNSLVLGFSVACLCLLFAVPMAWGVSRTNMPAKNLIQLLVLSTFVTPPFLGATSWILLAGPNAGWLNRAFMGIFGTESGIRVGSCEASLRRSNRGNPDNDKEPRSETSWHQASTRSISPGIAGPQVSSRTSSTTIPVD